MPRRVFNLELDLRKSDIVTHKIRRQLIYAQNLYAALCNNDFAPKDTWAILKNIRWNCTWNQAASMIAEIREQEDYSVWYASGVRFKNQDLAGFVEESFITEEVQEDLDQVGWLVLTNRQFYFPD